MRTMLRVIVTAALAAAFSLVALPSVPAGESAPVTVTKVVSGTAPAGATFHIMMECTGSGGSPNIVDDETYPADGGSPAGFGIPAGYEGDCTFTEDVTSGATVTYACSVTQVGAATCGGGGTSPVTLNVNDPSPGELAAVTVTNTFAADAVVALPTTTG
jgi:hypothetical protein